MKNVLFVAHLQSHIVNFHMPYIEYFKERGYTVFIATKLNRDRYDYIKEDKNIKWVDVDIPRTPYSYKAFSALKELKTLMKEVNFNLIHVHTPVGGFLGRLAAKISGSGPVLYTAHGFHFYKGAPLSYWLTYYIAERIASRWTDGLITINKEDYVAAKSKLKVRNNSVFKVNGVGVEFNNFDEEKDVRKELELGNSDFVITMIGELNKNKNQMQLVKSLPEIICNHSNVKVIFAGEGEEVSNLKEEAEKLGISNNIMFLGWRNDIYNIIEASDIICSFSQREGLPKNIMEAMILGKPVIATDVRGNKDLIKHGFNGYLVGLNDFCDTRRYLIDLIENKEKIDFLRKNTLDEVEKYKLKSVMEEMNKIYQMYLRE